MKDERCKPDHDHCHTHNHGHCHKPVRKQPIECGKVDTTKPCDTYDCHVPFKKPHCGYKIPHCDPFTPGMTVQHQINHINGKMDELICLFNKYDDKIWGAYDELVCSTLYNDAYYKEIKVMEGYLSEVDAKYKVVKIPFLDCCGEPIYLELGLAYDNATNSGVQEDAFHASERKLADKMIPACNIGKWAGLAMWNNAPINNEPSTALRIDATDTKYTFGITHRGFMKWYSNTVDYTVLQHDGIKNAMGCQGVLIGGGNFTTDKFPANATELKSRVGLGQNFSTKERYIVIVDGTNSTGCTSQQLADIFMQYGCDIACETANGESSSALDKGEFMFLPSTVNSETEPVVPQYNAFWYINKRRHYKNEYVRDVAELIQKVGQSIWRAIISNNAMTDIRDYMNQFKEKLEKEIQDRIEGDEDLQTQIVAESDERIEGDKLLQNQIDKNTTDISDIDGRLTTVEDNLTNFDANLQAEIEARQNADEDLLNQIQQEVQDRVQSESEIDRRIDEEIANRISGDSNLSNRLNEEVANRTNEISRIDSVISTINGTLTAVDTLSKQNYQDIIVLKSQMETLRTDMESLDNVVIQMQSTVDGIIQGFNEIKALWVELSAKFTALETRVEELEKLDPVVSVRKTETDKDTTYQLITKNAVELSEIITVPKDSGDSVVEVKKVRTFPSDSYALSEYTLTTKSGNELKEIIEVYDQREQVSDMKVQLTNVLINLGTVTKDVNSMKGDVDYHNTIIPEILAQQQLNTTSVHLLETACSLQQNTAQGRFTLNSAWKLDDSSWTQTGNVVTGYVKATLQSQFYFLNDPILVFDETSRPSSNIFGYLWYSDGKQNYTEPYKINHPYIDGNLRFTGTPYDIETRFQIGMSVTIPFQYQINFFEGVPA